MEKKIQREKSSTHSHRIIGFKIAITFFTGYLVNISFNKTIITLVLHIDIWWYFLINSVFAASANRVLSICNKQHIEWP